MIKSIEQCIAVQQRRVDSKKRGYSKAVRTFVIKNLNDDNYREIMDSLPVNWKKQEDKKIKTR